MLTEVLARGLTTALCTVYYPRFPEAAFQRMAVPEDGGRGADGVQRLCIVRAAFARGLPLLDLRLICAEEGDYANPIEPSAQGGEKIARAIAELVQRGYAGRRTEVFTCAGMRPRGAPPARAERDARGRKPDGDGNCPRMQNKTVSASSK